MLSRDKADGQPLDDLPADLWTGKMSEKTSTSTQRAGNTAAETLAVDRTAKRWGASRAHYDQSALDDQASNKKGKMATLITGYAWFDLTDDRVQAWAASRASRPLDVLVVGQ